MALVAVDETTLSRLHAATTNASDEVTPPLMSENIWSSERIAWFKAFHRDRLSGLEGPSGEATWAIRAADQIVAVRLKRTAEPGILETGIWLVRGIRGRGVGPAAMCILLHLAAELGARAVRADTTKANVAALGLLKRLGFGVAFSDKGDDVEAVLMFGAG